MQRQVSNACVGAMRQLVRVCVCVSVYVCACVRKAAMYRSEFGECLVDCVVMQGT